MPDPALLTLPALIDAVASDADRAAARAATGRPAGPITGIAPLDVALGGHLAAGLHVLHGAPGTGKTALALQVATMCGAPALVVTCEMAPVELARRVIARTTGTYLHRLKSGELDGHAVRSLAHRATTGAGWVGILDATQGPAPTVEDMHAALDAVRSLARRGGDAGRAAADTGALLVVDSGHAWASGLDIQAGPVTEYDRLNAAINGLHGLARHENAAVLVTAERNRASMVTGGQNAAAGTRTWEYRAETVLDLTDDDKDKDARSDALPTGPRKVVIGIHKNRHGPPLPWGVPAMWDGRLQAFTVRR
jgi:replicative DNA helicase